MSHTKRDESGSSSSGGSGSSSSSRPTSPPTAPAIRNSPVVEEPAETPPIRTQSSSSLAGALGVPIPGHIQDTSQLRESPSHVGAGANAGASAVDLPNRRSSQPQYGSYGNNGGMHYGSYGAPGSYGANGMQYGSYGQGPAQQQLQFAPGSFGANAYGQGAPQYGSYGMGNGGMQYGSYGMAGPSGGIQFGSYGANPNGGMQYGSYGVTGNNQEGITGSWKACLALRDYNSILADIVDQQAGSFGHRYGSFGNKFPGGSPGRILDPNDFRTNKGALQSDRTGIKQSQREGELTRDYTCCGLQLTDLHALLEHFEDVHVVVVDPYTQQPQLGYPPNQHPYAGQYAPPYQQQPPQQTPTYAGQQPYVGQNGYTPTPSQDTQQQQHQPPQFAGPHYNSQGIYVDANGQPLIPSSGQHHQQHPQFAHRQASPQKQPQHRGGRSGESSYVVPSDTSFPFDPDDMELDGPSSSTQAAPLASALSNLSFNSSAPTSPAPHHQAAYGGPPSTYPGGHYPSPPNAPHPALQQYSLPNSPAAGRAIVGNDGKTGEARTELNTKPINAVEAPRVNGHVPVSAFDTTAVLPRQRGFPPPGYHPTAPTGYNPQPNPAAFNSRASIGGYTQGYTPAAYHQQRPMIGGFPNTNGYTAPRVTPSEAFNAYSGYSDFSSQLPGTHPSPTGGENNKPPPSEREFVKKDVKEDPVDCLPPALLFASGQPPRASSPSSNYKSNGSPTPSATSTSSTTTTSTKEGPQGGSKSRPPQKSAAPSSSQPGASSTTARGSHAAFPRPGPSSSLLTSKPFRCPKPNCNKSYKQANGLKYHMTHGSCNFAPPKDLEQVQVLLANKRNELATKRSEQDLAGASSASASTTGSTALPTPTAPPVDPNQMLNQALSDPNYDLNQRSEGELQEMVAETERQLRPFACSVGDCNRRYKNMNGLRYHYQHSGDHGVMGLALLASGVHECLTANKNRPTPLTTALTHAGHLGQPLSASGHSTPSGHRTPVNAEYRPADGSAH